MRTLWPFRSGTGCVVAADVAAGGLGELGFGASDGDMRLISFRMILCNMVISSFFMHCFWSIMIVDSVRKVIAHCTFVGPAINCTKSRALSAHT